MTELHRSLRWRLGDRLFCDMLDATNGTQRYLGLAAKHIKITKVHYDENVSLFHDPALPFFKDSDNEDYFKYMTSGQPRNRSRSPEPKMRQWGNADPSGWAD